MRNYDSMTMGDRFDRMDELHAEFCQRRVLNECAVDVVQTCIVRGLRVNMFRALELMETMDNSSITALRNRIETRDDPYARYSREDARSWLPDRMVSDLT